MRKFTTEYRVIRWNSPEALAKELEIADETGWQADVHRIMHEEGQSGWTILKKTTEIRPDENNATVPMREIWLILNRYQFEGGASDKPNKTVESIIADFHALYERFYPAPPTQTGGRQ